MGTPEAVAQHDRDTPGASRRHGGAPARSKAWRYALSGALLGQGAPIGAAVLQTLMDGRSPFGHVGEHKVLYAYMSLATGIAFSLFGCRLGFGADDLIRQRRALRQANHRLTRLSEIDALTRVLNRRAVHARLLAELKRAQRDGSTVALLMLDLDHFKRVNDSFGHAAGDRVLRRVGRHLRRMARATDSAGRIGGEEFLVVLPATGAADAQSFAERLRIAIATRPANAAVPHVTVSIGVLVLLMPDPSEMEEGLRLVDGALYRAKAEGRNRVCLAPGFPDARSTGREDGGSGSLNPDRTSR